MKLTLENIELSVAKAREYLGRCRGEEKDRTKLCLWLEELLLSYRDRLGEEGEYNIQLSPWLRRGKIRLTVSGAMLDPFYDGDDPETQSPLLRSYLAYMGLRPVWHYAHGRNLVMLSMPGRGADGIRSLLISLCAALVLGLLARALPDQIRMGVLEGFVRPVNDTFVGFLNAVAVPMMFFSILWGVYSMGDISSFSRIGSTVCGIYMLVLTAVAAIILVLMLPLFTIEGAVTTALGGMRELFQMVLDIVPDNLIIPFSTGNTMQVMFIAIVFGLALILLGERAQGAATAVDILNSIVQTVMGFINRLIPIFIFFSFFNIVCGGDFSSLGMCGSYCLSIVLFCTVVLVFHTVLCCVRLRISPMLLWKKALPTFLIGLTTASSAAALSASMSSMTKKFGVAEKLAGFGVPMGQVIYMPGGMTMLMCSALSISRSCGISVSPAWLLSMLVMSVCLSVAAPATYGAGLMTLSALFVQLALPTEQMALVLTLSVLLDFVYTATSLFGDQCVLLIIAERLGMLDRNVLMQKSD